MNTWTERLRDTLLDNSALRDGLTDDEAQPLIDWGLAQAERVTAGLDGMMPEIAEAHYETLSSALPKLLTRITWLAVHRERKGPQWTQQTIDQINRFSQDLYGQDAPQLPPDSLSTLAQPAPNGPYILTLIRYLSPTESVSDDQTQYE